LPGKVGQKKNRTFQDTYQVQWLVSKISAYFIRQLLNALFDAFSGDKHAHTFVEILSLTRCGIALEFCGHGMDSNRTETLAQALPSEQAAPALFFSFCAQSALDAVG
jgi:hypothetical protein